MEEQVKIEELATICKVLSSGGVILYPTDTIWGIGCDATNDRAIKRIYKIKKRPPDQPFLILVDSIEMLKRYTNKIHPRIETLLQYHERPLTVLYKQPMGVSPLLISDEQMIAIRVVKEGFCHDMISTYGSAIVSTSANLHGEPYPKGFGSISSAIIRDVDFVVRAGTGEQATGMPSVIASFNHKGDLHFIRE
jgi:L-threonylcarbamoyladenylate synthase